MDNAQAKAELGSLFQRLGLATAENNRGFGLLPVANDRWRTVLMGHAVAYERKGWEPQDARAGAQYDSRTFFKSWAREGNLHIRSLALKDFSFWEDWGKRRVSFEIRDLTLGNIEEIYSMLVEHLDQQLEDLGKMCTTNNRIYLLNLIMARKQGWLPTLERKQFSPEVPDLAIPMLKWWDAGIPVEYTLHFFNPYIGGGFIKSGNSLFSATVLNSENRPALSLTEVKKAVGIPVTKLRALYPNDAERF